MVTRTKDQNTLSLGDWNTICDRCGFKFKNVDLREEWNGWRTCRDCWESRHPADLYQAPSDNSSVPWTRTEQTASGGTDINGNTFPPSENTTATGQGTKPDSDADGLVEGDFLPSGESATGTVSKG